MKRIFTLLTFMCIAYASDAQRMVFIEEFTQASCPPCEASTPMLDATLHDNADKVVQIRYQTSWPGVDPMNADNPTEVQARVDYYGVTGVPTLKINGADAVGANFPTLVTQANIDNEAAESTPISMSISHTIAEDLSGVDVTISVTNDGTEAYSGNMLRVALVEEEINWPAPPGSTSIQDYEYVMKKFVTDVAGMALPEIAAGETWDMTWEAVEAPGVVYNFNKLAVVAWVQNDANQSVDNAAVSNAIELTGYADLGISTSATAAGGLCDLAFTGSASVANVSDIEVSDYTVGMVINGEVVATVEGTEAIAAGGSVDVSFEEINLPPGTSAIAFAVQVASGDIASLNNVSSSIVIGKAGAVTADYNTTYEDDAIGALPANGLVDRPFENLNFIVISAEGLGTTDPLGGFGESTNSLMINFWQWDITSGTPADGSITVADQYLVTESSELSFDHAFTSWQGSADRLRVQVSTDCGETFSSVWDERGSTLATAPELNNGQQFFVPTPDQWRQNRVSLADFWQHQTGEICYTSIM